MNRRRLFSLFPLSLLGLAASVKAEPNDPSIWVEHVCEKRFTSEGERVVEPFPQSTKYIFKAIDESDRHKMYLEDLKIWEDARVCGQRFKHLVGANVKCPSCGEHSCNYKDAKGVPL